MKLKELINKSWYGSIGYIENNDSIETFHTYLYYNYSILKEFKGHVFAFTYKEFQWEILKDTIHHYFPDAEIILVHENRGYNFGNADLDNAVFDYCKENNISWLCKSAMDIILTSQVLDVEVSEADFYYLNGIGYGGMQKYNFNLDEIIKKDFVPQTNFYFINVDKTDFINDKQYLEETFTQINQTPDYNGKIWEYIPGWTCERFLKQCVERNKLNKYHIVSPKKYVTLLNLIKNNQIVDPSHKNIMIEGICHFAFPNSTIYEL